MELTHDSKSFFLKGPVGRLEAILWTPQTQQPAALAAVICHPHPLFGGTLHNKVIYQTAKTLDALGIPTLRFNFRGAGMSQGTHDKGRGEQGDVQCALDTLAHEFPGIPLLLAGFSFGSWVGLRVGCADARVDSLVALGVPVNSTDFTYLWDCAKPKLFVHGAKDQFGSQQKVEELVATVPGENRLVFVPEADHFFTGLLEKLDEALREWLLERYAFLPVR